MRELKHVLHRAVLLAQGSTVQACDIELDGEVSGGAFEDPDAPISFHEAKARTVDAFERHYLEQLLMQSHGNITQAARLRARTGALSSSCCGAMQSTPSISGNLN
ncbi:hypothetical protein LP415_01970 [Polaromonas sp. P1(28)-8]|nr:hypothetical protein LP415_01970 [Polaromonas sp. P1(28)-8]